MSDKRRRDIWPEEVALYKHVRKDILQCKKRDFFGNAVAYLAHGLPEVNGRNAYAYIGGIMVDQWYCIHVDLKIYNEEKGHYEDLDSWSDDPDILEHGLAGCVQWALDRTNQYLESGK